jgi:hypothetical protein
MKKGSVSLTTLLVVGTILFISGTSLLISMLDLLDNSNLFVKSKHGQIDVKSCLEQALIIIKNDVEFEGNGSIILNGADCQYSISTNQQSSNLKNVYIFTSKNNIEFEQTKIIDTSQRPFAISNI